MPGDEIVGFVTRGRGVSIHRTDCTNIVNLPESDRARIIDAEWQEMAYKETGESYSTEIKILPITEQVCLSIYPESSRRIRLMSQV